MARNLKARKRLSELYKRGVEIRFGPDGGRIGPFDDEGPAAEDEVALWISPPDPFQREQALREANAKRARALVAAKRDPDSEEQLTARAFLADMGLPTLIDYIALHEDDEIRGEAIREVLAREEWKDITELQDALRQFDEDETPEDDPEYAAVIARDDQYGKEVAEREASLREAAREGLALLQRDELERRGIDKRADLIGSQAFMNAYELQMTYYSVRDIDQHNLLFYDSPRELAEAEDQIQTTIKEALAGFINDVAEAKNLQRVVDGSAQSTPPNAPETSEPSIPEGVNA